MPTTTRSPLKRSYNASSTNNPSKKPKTSSSNKKVTLGPHLRQLLQVYKGLDDWHLPIFRSIQRRLQPQDATTKTLKVLYPGCSRHITTSLVFDHVTYVDCDTKIKDFFQDTRVRDWVQEHKEYDHADAKIAFACQNFESSSLKLPTKQYDLLISASAGIVSLPCAANIKKGGHLLVSDAHFDARQAFVNPQFRLVAAVQGSFLDKDHTKKTKEEGEDTTRDSSSTRRIATLECEENELDQHFTTTCGTKITPAQVAESQVKPKARRSFKLKKEGMFYLFEKI